MISTQAIRTPFGITVFGSAISRIAPDIASLRVSVSRLEQKPADAFAKARQGSQAIQECLRKARISEFGASRVTLTQEHRYIGRENKFVGYLAKVSFHITLTELDRVEEVLTALVAAGANGVDGVSFETTRLKEVRAEARRRAIAAALDKANNYCAAAGVSWERYYILRTSIPLCFEGARGMFAVNLKLTTKGMFALSIRAPYRSEPPCWSHTKSRRTLPDLVDFNQALAEA